MVHATWLQQFSSWSIDASHCENTSATFFVGPRFWHQMSRPSGEQAQTQPSSSGPSIWNKASCTRARRPSTVAVITLALLGLGAGVALLIRGVAAAYVVRFLELALLVQRT
jgi:hypothetical protein